MPQTHPMSHITIPVNHVIPPKARTSITTHRRKSSLAQVIDKVKKPASNYIRTTHTTPFTFLPVSLFNQFRRLTNIYFLFAAVLTLIPSISSISPVFQVLPLALVLIVTSLKDLAEDLVRFKADKAANQAPYVVIRESQEITIPSKDLIPGDIIRLGKGDKIPADMMIISSSYDDGSCFIETAELDGETNLKRRAGLKSTMHLINSKAAGAIEAVIECEPPNNVLSAFEGRLTYYKPASDAPSISPLNASNLLLRGAVLRNTEFLFAVVVYVGNDTKVMQNLKTTGSKYSTMEKVINLYVICIFVYNAIILIVSAVLALTLDQQGWYIKSANNDYKSIFTYYILYTYSIPISMFVTLEIVRVVQAQFIHWDAQMISTTHGRAKTNNSNLNEELGSVDYVVSDKTGTLTRNIMKLSKWYIWDKVYDVEANPLVLEQYLKQSNHIPNAEAERVRSFVQLIALCHSVIPTIDEKTQLPMYEAQSPDEAALLNAILPHARVVARTKYAMTISSLLSSAQQEWRILEVLEFTSDRKRCSILVEDPQLPEYVWLYCKGADNIILDRLHPDSDAKLLLKAKDQIEVFANQGLRTLMVASKRIPRAEYESWRVRFDKASTSLNDREGEMNREAETIEKEMDFIGCTAIEDRLQDKVPETIEFILRCGVKVWVLTGDKQETAINIATSSRLFNADMEIHILNARTKQDCSHQLQVGFKFAKANHAKSQSNALVINGECLAFILADFTAEFLEFAELCHSVICCRVTPLQKALVVTLIRTKLKKVVLSIGDGANDVSMIQAANVGIGIAGMEGAQAVRAADFAIGEFQFLKRLMVVHGRWSVLRISQLVLFSLYKNLAMITSVFLYQIYNNWTGEQLYEQLFLTLFNVVFTSLPPVVAGWTEKDATDDLLEKYARLYTYSRLKQYVSAWNASGWLLSAFWHALVIYFGSTFLVQEGVIALNGRAVDYDALSTMSATFCLGILLLQYSLHVHSWNILTFLAVLLSAIFWLIVEFNVEAFSGPPWRMDVVSFHNSGIYWFGILLLTVTAILPNVTVAYISRALWPTDCNILQERREASKSKKRKDSIIMRRLDG